LLITALRQAFIRDETIRKIGVIAMKTQKITFDVCPRCQSTFINQIENENPTWQCSDCLYTFELPLIARFPEIDSKDDLE